MFTVRRLHLIVLKLALMVGFAGLAETGFGQPPSSSINGANSSRATGRPVTIPLTIKINSRQLESDDELQNIDLTVSEDGEPQTILSIRGIGTNSPITLAVLIQDDVVPSIGNEIKAMAEFIRGLPKGSRVMVGYLRTGSLQVKQKFTNDLEKAAKALRPPLGFPGTGPFNPYIEVIEALKKFDSQPSGRRAILLVSDGLDISRDFNSSGPTQSIDLQRAINESQRRSVAIYGFYAPTVGATTPTLAANAQSSLLRLANETGGHAFFQGLGAPVSFDPFIRELDISLEKQVALTFLSTHMNKGFHRIQVRSATPGVEVTFPSGYVR